MVFEKIVDHALATRGIDVHATLQQRPFYVCRFNDLNSPNVDRRSEVAFQQDKTDFSTHLLQFRIYNFISVNMYFKIPFS